MTILKYVDFEVPNFGELALPSMAVPDYASAVMALTPLAYWRMGEQTGTTLADETGNYPLQLSGAHSLLQDGALTYDNNEAIHFSGAVATANAPLLPGGVNAPFSVAFWVRAPAGPIDGGAIMGQFTTTSIGHTRLHIPDDGRLRLTILNGVDVYSTQQIDTSWRFAVLTRSGAGLVRWFVDGQLDVEQSGGGDAIAPIDFLLGQVTTNSVNFFLDEVAIFHHELSADQVRWLYGLAMGQLALPDGL